MGFNARSIKSNLQNSGLIQWNYYPLFTSQLQSCYNRNKGDKMGPGLLLLGIMAIAGIIGGIIFIWFLLTWVLPRVFNEFKLLTSLYYEMKLGEAIPRHFVHFFLFLFPLFFILLISFTESKSVIYTLLMALFLLSGFFGFYIFAYFLYAISKDNSRKVLISVFLGAIVALVFAPSGYFALKPIYEYMTSQHYKEAHASDACHDHEDWLVGGECTSRNLTLDDVVGKWKMLPTRDAKEGTEAYGFTLESNGSVDFHGYVLVANTDAYYDYIEHIDSTGTWTFHLKGKGLISSSFNPDERHPYVEITLKKAKKPFILRFNSTRGTALYLQNQYDDFDAPYYLTYQHVEGNRTNKH